jgi:ribosomal protein L11 methyltransferase
MPATWTAVIVSADRDLEESLASFLIDRGAPGLIVDADGARVTLTAHFADAPPLAALERYCDALQEQFPAAGRPAVRTERVADAAWAENWKAHFPPLAVGARLYVHPPWVTEIPAGRLGIELDPGMAFGTGHHASTRGCLRLLDAEARVRSLRRVLDIGTGSGILAIAAARLGAEKVWGVDTDPDACAVARENARINRVDDRVHIGTSLAAVSGRFDVVLANLFAPQLIELAPRIAAFLVPDGLAIGAGILSAEASAVEMAWARVGLRPGARDEEDGWVTLAGRAPGAGA